MRQDFRYTLERIIEKAKEKEDAAYSQAKVIMMATTLAMVLGLTGDEAFMSKEEYLEYREERSPGLLWAYEQLPKVPHEHAIEKTGDVEGLMAPGDRVWAASKGGIKHGWSDMDPYWKYIVACYGKDLRSVW
ncbi:uncharacterized protein HMPREF1541_11051 [Cyphellophora europaea CBS 101466]|uniref:Uncharacterized protein n=1 Tax=Cyphellophora europaea (strain CBS 101466) TaxID=1220924 RepID=W2S5P7_CYPE1|nr:uncharacterized protein HMPREF1541_11051 [Cyphellophora europaea CBS 101466]ETN43920.1 hypothetical protein HMPREF1541_11051 [Cyphellophora europaea CBS 101466]